MFLSRLRDHYVDQLLVFIAEQRRNFPQGASEVKVELEPGSPIFRNLVCADFVRSQEQPEIMEFEPDRLLGFDPVTASLGNAEVSFEHVRWDDVVIHHDAQTDLLQALGPWFEKWFDPDDRRYFAGFDLANVIHSLAVEPRKLSVDLGSAGADALWELLDLLERSGATAMRITSARAEATAS
jgi:hypothetical protein